MIDWNDMEECLKLYDKESPATVFEKIVRYFHEQDKKDNAHEQQSCTTTLPLYLRAVRSAIATAKQEKTPLTHLSLHICPGEKSKGKQQSLHAFVVVVTKQVADPKPSLLIWDSNNWTRLRAKDIKTLSTTYIYRSSLLPRQQDIVRELMGTNGAHMKIINAGGSGKEYRAATGEQPPEQWEMEYASKLPIGLSGELLHARV